MWKCLKRPLWLCSTSRKVRKNTENRNRTLQQEKEKKCHVSVSNVEVPLEAVMAMLNVEKRKRIVRIGIVHYKKEKRKSHAFASNVEVPGEAFMAMLIVEKRQQEL
mmetsp:Transcript_30576/g.44682  ORF Transcript_30576/g.44682 Transcript_30576/m.44682 type:complete len:106 (+) Transcript_30576:8-325(+)